MRQDQENLTAWLSTYELKCTPDDIISDSLKDLRVCN